MCEVDVRRYYSADWMHGVYVGSRPFFLFSSLICKGKGGVVGMPGKGGEQKLLSGGAVS